MKIRLVFFFIFLTTLLSAQSKVLVDVASPKPSITIDGVNCVIGNTIYSCMPKTCNPVTITQGDSIEFCTNQEIYLHTDSAYWMQWNFTGSSNYPQPVYDSFPSNTPICYYPKWTAAGNYTIDIFYNGWLSAYPASDCYSFGPSHWIVNVIVQTNVGIVENKNRFSCEIFPNPSTGIFNLTISDEAKIETVFVTDIAGKKIKEPVKKNEIDLSAYPAGIYFLNIATEDGSAVKKLIRE
jgi:hypothetical protein